ncbi:MAG: S8 family serine peptidase [Candidatus Altiarchaeota archaeon]
MILRGWLGVFLVTVFLLGAAYASSEEMVVGGEKRLIDPILEERISKASSGEKIDSIIFFRDTPRGLEAKGHLSALFMEDEENRINYRYENFNALAGSFTAEKLRQLLVSDDVVGLFFDHPVSLLGATSAQGNLSTLLKTSAGMIGSRQVWEELNFTGRGVTVAVLDTGIDYNHTALNNCTYIGPGCRIKDGWDFAYGDSDPSDVHGHGTQVSGIIGANRSDVMGVAPEVGFFAVKVMDDGGHGNSSHVLAGIDWAIGHGADVISMSIGDKLMPNNGLDLMDVFAQYAIDHGIVVSVAAGNVGPDSGTINTPASASGVIAVGSVDDHSNNFSSDDNIYETSSRGPAAFGRIKPDVVAPGVSIFTTDKGGGTASATGTSMACPHVSGAAALMLEADRSLSPADVRARLMHSSQNVINGDNSIFDIGAGFINVSKAITQKLYASVSGGDRWEATVRSGDMGVEKLILVNAYNRSLTLNISSSDFSDPKEYSQIGASNLSLTSQVLLVENSSTNVTIQFSMPDDSVPGTYGGLITIESNNSDSIRFPISVTVPYVDEGSFSGRINKDNIWGDHLFYRLDNSNASSMNVTLSWGSQANNLNLYIYTPQGVLLASSTSSTSNNESIFSDNLSYSHYWIRVHANSISGQVPFNISVSYSGNLSLQPTSWQGLTRPNESVNINFTILNDGLVELENISFHIKGMAELFTETVNGSLTESDFTPYWTFNQSNVTRLNSMYLDALLEWQDSSKDLDAAFIYSNGTNWLTDEDGRYCACHWNNLLNESLENLSNVDIRYYLDNYLDVGVGLRNANSSEDFNLSVSIRGWDNFSEASLAPASYPTLSPSQEINVSINISTASLSFGTHDLLFQILDSSGQQSLGQAPISLAVTSTTLTTTIICPDGLMCFLDGWNMVSLSIIP